MEKHLEPPTTNLDFGSAIVYLKSGARIQRAGWNGKGMYLYLNKGFVSRAKPIHSGHLIDGILPNLFELGLEGSTTRLPNINMMSATGSIVTGWLASQTDILADDWQLYQPKEEVFDGIGAIADDMPVDFEPGNTDKVE